MPSGFALSTSPPDAPPAEAGLALGLSRNWRQFSLLVVVNAFVGGMVGLERAVLPLLAEREFGLASKAAILSFIVSFGVVKAVANLAAGRWSETVGRKPLLVAGWIAALPVPFLLTWAPSWNWVVAANMLLGVNQGLCWSTTVVMKIDLVGPRRRGIAMGLNEFAGYTAVALAAWGCALIADAHGFRTALFTLGVVLSAIGLLLSVFFVTETRAFARSEARLLPMVSTHERSFARVFMDTSVGDRNLSACSQAGLVNNLNDGVAWGLFPLLYASAGLAVADVGLLAAIYPAVWGLTQVVTGALSDRWGRKWPIAIGMWIQAIGIWSITGAANSAQPYPAWITGNVLLGLGTALVYPTLLAAIADRAHPSWRASAVGVYRLWRDLGYAVGAIVCGLAADWLGLRAAIVLVGALTFASGVICAVRMIDSEREQSSHAPQPHA
jgi:MFS family permease